MPVISPDNHLAVMAMMVMIVGATLWLERFAIVQKLSVAAVVIIIPLVLSNFGLIPREAPAYSFASQYFVTIAVPLLLFKADLRRIFTETGRTMIVFLLAAAGTVLGAGVAGLVVPLEELGAQAAAAMTGGYIGGGMNFVAVSRAVELDADPTRFATTLGAETAAGLFYLMFLAAAPAMKWFARWDKGYQAKEGGAASAEATFEDERAGMLDLGLGLGLALTVCALGQSLATLAGYPRYAILVITVLSLILANVAPAQMARLRGEAALGMFLLYVFFAAYGAGTDLVAMLRTAPLLMLFAVLIIGVHFVFVFGAGRLLGFSAREVATASNACVLGPPTAAALAKKEGWDDLITPGVLCGVFGYVIGNFIGVTVFAFLN